MRFGRLGVVVVVTALVLAGPGALFAQTRPDLIVIDVTSPPATALPGDSFAATATVKNQSFGLAPASSTRFYLVSTTGTTRKNLRGLQSVDALGIGASGGPEVTLGIYSDTLPGTYALQACADGPGDIPELSELNNCRTSLGTVTILELPDLVVTAITDPPATAPLGQPFNVTATIQNTGAVPASSASTKYYLVSTATGARKDLKGTQQVPALGAGQQYSQEQKVIVRADTVLGDYQLQACADAGKIVPEDNEDDNCLTSVGVVRVTPQPDLLVSSIGVVGGSVSVAPGGALAIDTVVTNLGQGVAPSSVMKFALVNTTSGATKNLNGTQAVPGLASGGQTPLQTPLTVYSDTALGTYTVRACIDPDGVIAEGSETNNCASTTTTVTVTLTALTAPDLAVSKLLPPPASALPGDSFTVAATVVNHGTAASPASVTKFYLVSRSSGRPKNLNGVQNVTTLAPGASGGPSVTVAVYADTIPGAYRLQACADGPGDIAELDEDDNCTTAPDDIQILDSPDLVVTSVGNPPREATQGQAIQVTAIVKNVGEVPAIGSVTRYYLVSTVDDSKTDLKGKPAVPPLGRGQTFTERDTVVVRATTVPGTYQLQACADSGKAVVETNDDNNCLTASGVIRILPRPDLVPTSVVIKGPQPFTVALGGTIFLKAVIENQGPGPAAASGVRFFLVDAAGISKDLKGTPDVPALDPRETATIKQTVTVFADTLPGTYALRACADFQDVVAETVETNNCAMATGTVTVTAQ